MAQSHSESFREEGNADCSQDETSEEEVDDDDEAGLIEESSKTKGMMKRLQLQEERMEAEAEEIVMTNK
ncbi:MAG: hypothetical protein M1828_007579 [Chrysothrix sp. TS-e1954]|nr:MAG: hypothetical protein M1828_007579 [Chrysothrix sp. TS-e1954]